MSKTKRIKETKDERTFLERLPSNLPFLPVVRRPDYQLRRVRLVLPTSIPPSIITAVVLVGLLFIYIGGSFDLTQDPIAFGSNPSTGDPVVISPYRDHQYLVEGMAAGLLMFIGAGGFFLIYYSTQYAYSPRNSTVLLVVGIGTVVLAWVAIMFMFNKKVY